MAREPTPDSRREGVNDPALPAWLATPTPTVEQPARRPHRFLRKTLAQLQGLLASISEPPGRLAEFDPRIKLITAVVVLVIVSLLRSPLSVTTAAILAVLGAVSVGAGRVLLALAAPITALTAIMLLPAVTTLVRPGATVVSLGAWGGHPIGLTQSGLINLWLVLARVVASLAVVVLLTRTTSWLRLTAALRGLGAPTAFVLIATMAHRYLWVLAHSVMEVMLARRARSVAGTNGSDDRAFVGGSVGALFVRSNELADQVYQAMVARGFTGRLADPTPGRLRWSDVVAGLAVIATSLALLWGDLVVR